MSIGGEPERDLERMLATLTVTRRPGTFTYIEVPRGAPVPPALAEAAAATVGESEGTTYVVPVELASMVDSARRSGFEAAWLTLDVHSALDAIGLTAAFSSALGRSGIACNVIAGYHHDHLLVPVEQADDAIRALDALRDGRT